MPEPETPETESFTGWHPTLDALLEGLAPRERIEGLDRDQQALALPDEVLPMLTETYISSLSPEVQEELRRRLQRASH